MSRRLLVVVNAAAGTADDDSVETALAVLREGADVRVVATASVEELDAAVAGRDGRELVAVGGDGSLHALVGALDRAGELTAEDPVGLLGRGTGNDLARALGLPLDPVAGARALLAGRPRTLDLLRDDDGGVVVNAVHLGVGASAGRRAEWLKDLIGVVAYPVGAALAGAAEPGWALRVEIDGAVVTAPSGWAADGETLLLMVGVGNGPSIGGGTPLVPDARPDDGLLDVMVCAATGPAERVAYGAALRSGEHVDREDVVVVRGREVTVSGEAVEADADGEVHGPLDRVSWRVEPGAWSILVPTVDQET